MVLQHLYLYQSSIIPSIHSIDPPLRLWNMGLDPSSLRQDCCLWQLLPPKYPTDFLHSSCYQPDVWLRVGSPPQLLPLIQTRRLHFFGRVAQMSDCQDTFRALHTSTRGLPKEWRRRPGRPRHTWLRTVNADLHPLNHGLNSAWWLPRQRTMEQLVEMAMLQPGARSWWWWWWWWWWWSTCGSF